MNIRACFVVWMCFATMQVAALDKETITLTGARGRDAVLPCGLGKVFLNDVNSYVSWINSAFDVIYQYPENNDERTSIMTVDDKIFGYRGKQRVDFDPTSLRLKNVQDSDEGSYLCRVQQNGTTLTEFIVEFRVVDPPQQPRILSGDGNVILGGVYQLVKEKLTLVCEIENVKPGTLVWWEKNSVPLTDGEQTIQGEVLTKRVQFEPTLTEQHARYECFAQSADVSYPLTATVFINVKLPMSVEIRFDKNRHFEADQPRVIDCVVETSVPQLSVTWHVSNTNSTLDTNNYLITNGGNFTLSTLTLIPSLNDDKSELTCRAQSPNLPGEVFEDKTILHVGYVPRCVDEQAVQMVKYTRKGVKANATCMLEAYPAPLQVNWILASSIIYNTNSYDMEFPPNRYTSSLVWHPSKQEEGKLLCTSFNMVGRQKKPCGFFVVPEGAPRTPDCTARHNETDIKISCNKDLDGAPAQDTHLELHTKEGIVHRATDPHGQFVVRKVWENVSVVVYASNDIGRSMSRFINITPEMNNVGSQKSKTYILILLIVGTVVLGTFIGVFARCIKFFQDGKGLPHSIQDIDEDDTTMNVQNDGTLHRLPEPMIPMAHACPHVFVRLSPDRKHYEMAAGRAVRVSGNPTMSPIAEENALPPDVVPDEMESYYV